MKRIKNLQEQNKFGEPKKTSTFYGAQSSINSQVSMVEKANTVLLPNGQEVKKEDAIVFKIGEIDSLRSILKD